MAQRRGYKNSLTQKLLSTMLSAMGDSFMEGDSFQVPGFGTFEVKKKMERIMVNPVSGQRMLVPPKLVLGFRPTSTWKDKINSEEDEQWEG